MAPPTHYDVLGVASSASAEEIRSAYRAAARTRHPDSGGSVESMQRLNEAWHVLSEPGRRSAYDRSLSQATEIGLAGAAKGPGSSSADDLGDPAPPFATWSEADPNASDTTDLADDPGWFEGPSAGVEGWWAMFPPGVLVFAVALFLGALVFTSPALLVFAGGAFFVSLGLFVLVPMRSMFQASRKRHPRYDD